MVVFAHVAEQFDFLPSMGWGLAESYVTRYGDRELGLELGSVARFRDL
jgi:hypothetical protein